MRSYLFPIFFLIPFLKVLSQDYRLIASNIPQELKQNANAVVRNSKTEITLLSIDQMIVKEKQIITVFNEKGNNAVNVYEHYDSDTKIKRLSFSVFNELGQEIEKISKAKFQDISAVYGATRILTSK